MRIAVTAALLLAGTAAASATTLSGKPFAVDPTTQAQQVNATLYETSAGGFGAVLAQDTTGDKVPDSIAQILYDAAGKQVGAKAVVRAADGAKTAGIAPGGALPLADGRTLVAASFASVGPGAPAGFLDGQFMKAGKPSGAPFALDNATKGQFYFGYLLELKGGRGLAHWTTTATLGGAQTTKGRFVSPAGKVQPANIDLTRPNAQFAGAHPFLDGFIGQHVQISANFKNATVWARIYDLKGADTGRQLKIADNKPIENALFVSAVGLTDGTILVMRSVKTSAGATLYARRYDGNWKPLAAEKILVTSMLQQPYAAHPLPNGDILVGAKMKDGANAVALEFRRFSPALAPVGAAARITGVAKPDFAQLLGLETGNAVATYTSDGKKLTGQIIKP